MQIINQLFKKLTSDFVMVFIANLFSYLVAFCGSIIYVRLLGKYQFGLYTFAFNIISLFLLLNGFGAASGVLQFISREKQSNVQLDYLYYAFKSGFLFNLIISLAILCYAYFAVLPVPEAKYILAAMALLPAGRLYGDIFQAYLRAKQLNYLQAKFSILNNSGLLLFSIIGVISYKIYGLIIFTYISYIVTTILSISYFKLPNLFKF